MYTDYSNQQSNIINGGSPFTKVNPSVPHPVQAPIPQQAYAFKQGYVQNNFDSEKQALINQNTELIKQQADTNKDIDILKNENFRLYNETQKLSNTILQMSAERQGKEIFFSSDNDGMNYCFENNKRIILGYFTIESVKEIHIINNLSVENFYYISYHTFGDDIYYAVVKESEFKSNTLHKLFPHFEFRSKCNTDIQNRFFRDAICKKGISETLTVPEYPGFFITDEKAEFFTGNNFTEPTLNKIISKNIINNTLDFRPIQPKDAITNLIQLLPADVNTYTLILLHFLSIISSILTKVNEPFNQIVVVKGNHVNLNKTILSFLQIYNKPHLSATSLSSTKHEIKNILKNSKDCTVCFNDISISDSEKKREETVTLLLNDLSEGNGTPHLIAVISDAAAYMVPVESLFCISVTDELLCNSSSDKLNAISIALQDFDYYLIGHICKNYSDFIYNLKGNISYFKKNAPNIPGFHGKSTYALLMFAVSYLNKLNFNMPVNRMSEHFISILEQSLLYDNNSCSGIVNNFSTQLNDTLRYGVLELTEYGKDMCYCGEKNVVIHKDNMLIFNEDTIKDIILPKMTHTQSLLHILKALDSEDILVKKKKNRFPLTVYTPDGRSERKDFIALNYSNILDTDVLDALENTKNNEFYYTNTPNCFLPLIKDNNGRFAGKEINFGNKENLHIYVTGKSGTGKTVFLSQLLCSVKNLGDKVIVFDTSQSFTYEELCNNLSTEFVDEHITFHSIEDDMIPVDIFSLSECQRLPEQKNLITGILTAPFDNLSQLQITSLKKTVSECIKGQKFDFASLLDKLEKGDKTELSLYPRLINVFEDMIDYGEDKATWSDFIESSRSIIVISLNNALSDTGNQIIDMLISSLYSYQVKNADRQLDIFIDEIQNQNLIETSPIAKIMKEGRKHHISLIFATQIVSNNKSTKSAILNQAGTSVFFKPEESSKSAVAEILHLKKNECYLIDELKTGECIVKSDFYSSTVRCNTSAILKGRTPLYFNSFSNRK